MAGAGAILIADDEDVFRLSAAEILRCRGFHCDTAADSRQAVEQLKSRRYDVLVADIKMPGNEDLELIHHIQHEAQDLPVILVTGYPSLYTAVESIRLPVVAYLTKPVEPEVLWTEVQNAIQQGRARRTAAALIRKLKGCAEGLGEVESALTAATQTASSSRLDKRLEELGQCLLGCLVELDALRSSIGGDVVPLELCKSLPCARRIMLQEAIKEAVGVIEGTRKTFKSRELADLRNQLQEVLQS